MDCVDISELISTNLSRSELGFYLLFHYFTKVKVRKSLRFGCRNVCFFPFCDGNKLISAVQSTTFTTKTQLMHQRNSLHQRRIQPQSKRSRWNYGMHPATIMPNQPSFFSLSLALNSLEENFSSELWVCFKTAIRGSEVTNETFSA